MSTNLAVVIPTLNEARAITATLNTSLALEDVGLSVERWVVDGRSDDATVQLVRQWASHNTTPGKQTQVIASDRGRAWQLNAGIASTNSDWLLFLHADTHLNFAAAQALKVVIDTGSRNGDWPLWGGFTQQFDAPCGPDWRLRMVSWLHRYRCQRTGTFYGDQAMFCHRSVIVLCGGFPLARMEDVLLSEQLKRIQPGLLLDETVVTSARKFVQQGVWRSLARVIALQRSHANGKAAHRTNDAFFTPVR
jgi:glycosyltransferase involved in cell wall biosynthesis